MLNTVEIGGAVDAGGGVPMSIQALTAVSPGVPPVDLFTPGTHDGSRFLTAASTEEKAVNGASKRLEIVFSPALNAV